MAIFEYSWCYLLIHLLIRSGGLCGVYGLRCDGASGLLNGVSLHLEMSDQRLSEMSSFEWHIDWLRGRAIVAIALLPLMQSYRCSNKITRAQHCHPNHCMIARIVIIIIITTPTHWYWMIAVSAGGLFLECTYCSSSTYTLFTPPICRCRIPFH